MTEQVKLRVVVHLRMQAGINRERGKRQRNGDRRMIIMRLAEKVKTGLKQFLRSGVLGGTEDEVQPLQGIDRLMAELLPLEQLDQSAVKLLQLRLLDFSKSDTHG